MCVTAMADLVIVINILMVIAVVMLMVVLAVVLNRRGKVTVWNFWVQFHKCFS